jgi:hypothetical protein
VQKPPEHLWQRRKLTQFKLFNQLLH